MLGEHDRRAPLLVESPQQRQQLVAGDRVELRGRLIEQQQARAPGERGPERDALQLAPGQRRRRALEQGLDAERERDLLDAARHRVRGLAAVLERERELGANRAHQDLRFGLLEEGPDLARQRRRAVVAQRHPADRGAASKRPPRKCGTSPQPIPRSVDLPLAEGPASTTNSPCAISSERSRSAGAAAPGWR